MGAIVTLFLFLVFPVLSLQSQNLTEVISKEEARQLAELIQMPGLDRFVSDQARAILSEELEGKMMEWISEETPGVAGRDIFKNDPEISRQLKEKIKARLIQWLPKQLERILQKELLKGETGKAIYTELNKTLNEQADQWVGGFYDRLMNKFDQRNNVLADQLGRLIGESAVKGLQNGILVGLKGELPEEAIKFLRQGPDKFAEYVEKGRAYLPGAQFQKFRDQLMQIHIVDLPNQVYGGILAASAAMHLAKAFAGPKVNFYELKRFKEVTQTLIWQLKNKQGVSLTLGDFTQMIKKLGDQFGSFHWRAFQQMAKWNPAKQFLDRLDQIETQFKKIDKVYDQVTGKVLAGFDQAIGQLQTELKKLSQELLGPMLNPIQCLNGIVAQDCPNVLPKIPDVTRWAGLKKALGLEKGIFGKWGDKSPWAYAKEFYEKSALNKKMAAGLATAAVKVTDVLHITGPLAKILKIEKIPARNASRDSDFDPVYLHNGEFYYTATDLALPGAGIDFQFARSYRSRSHFLGQLGYRWTHNLAQRLLPWQSPQGFGLTYVDGEGKKWFLKEVEVGVFQPPPDLGVQFKTISEGYSLTREGLTYQFNPDGILTAIQDQANHQLALVYNDAGQLTEVRDTLGREIRFHYFSNGLLAKLEDHTGRTWRYEYNEAHQLISATTPGTAAFPKGKTTRYAYENHQMVLIMDPKGQVYLQNYYGRRGKDKGKILAQKYGDGRYLTEARYDGLDTWVVDRRGVLHQYEHDEKGEKVSGTFLPESAWHLFEQEDSSAGNSPVLEHRSSSRCFAKRCQALSYDSWGNIVAIQSPNGGERRFEVDANNLITKEIVDGEERFYLYDANDNIIAIEVPARQLKLEFEYDILDQLITKKEILHEAKIITTRYEYDPQGRLTRLIYPLGNDIRFGYDEIGELSQVIRGEGTLDRVVESLRAEAASEAWRARSNPAIVAELSWPPSFPPPQQEAKTVRYDPLGRPIQLEGVSFAWDDNSRLAALTDVQGQTTHYFYDSLNRLVLEKFPDGTERSYAYDTAGRLTGKIDRDKTPIVYEYNEAGLLTKRSSLILTHEFFYDSQGRLTTAIDYNDLKDQNDDIEVHFAYDQKGRLVGEKIHGQWVRKSFDHSDQKTGITYPNGLQVVREYQDGKILNLFAEGRPLPRFQYQPENPEGPLDSVNTTALTRDPNGNLIADKKFQYSYDALNRLARVQDRNGIELVSYQYDALGRVAREVRPKARIDYFYDELNQIAAYSSNKTRRLYIYGSDLDQPVAFFNNNDLYYYHLDELGSVRQITDEVGALIEQYDYLPFGEMTIRNRDGQILAASSIGNPLSFIGRPVDATTQLVDLRHRYYSPSHHQFLTADPLGYKNEFYATPTVLTPTNFSYHQGQGGAPRTSFPNYVEEEGEKVLIDFDLLTITPPQPISIPETDLYSYAGGDPLHYYDPLGLYKVEVQLPPWDADPLKNQREKKGTLLLKNDQGWPVAGPYPVLGRSSNRWFSEKEGRVVANKNKNRDPLQIHGDTPSGEYHITKVYVPKDFRRYGPYAFAIDPMGGQALQAKLNGRADLLIHGGRPNSKSIFGPGLTPTLGCLRMHNQDIVRMIQSVKNLRERGDTHGTVIIEEGL